MLFNAHNRSRYASPHKPVADDEKPLTEHEEDVQDLEKTKVTVTTPWVSIYQAAATINGALEKPNPDSHKPFAYDLLNVALAKAIWAVHPSLDMDKQSIRREIITRLAHDSHSMRTPLGVVRFLRSVEPAWFVECSNCGYQNEPEWEVCRGCEQERETG